jgi:hypothetical protein
MTSLADRLREALHPDYEVEHEVGVGGMGVVFLARDVALERRVAVKVLLPELATVAASDRFLREARILASHSHIIPIHRVGEADGLFYYVMEFVEGETLADRLRDGPLAHDEVLKLGRDLLDALEASHERGVVHRDVKPDNIFVAGRRTMLGDFGIAKSPRREGEPRTKTGGVLGTPRYMPPEQASGREVTPQSDLYAVAMVLYEAITWRAWNSGQEPSAADWSGVPGGIARALKGALAFAPEDRWSDAATFRRHLWRTRVRRYQWRTALLTASGVVAGALGIWAFGLLTGGPGPGGLAVQIMQFQEEGDVPPGLTESVTAYVVRGLGQSLEFHVCELEEPCDNPTVTLTGTVRVAESTLSVTVRTEDLVRYSSQEGQVAEWMEVADGVTSEVLRTLWSENSPLAEWLPLDALPTSTAGFNRWLEAERLFNHARWEDAREVFVTAADIDTTCWLCSWRILEADRQHPGKVPDTTHIQRVLSHTELFPSHYQQLLQLETLDLSLDDRIQLLRYAVRMWPDFYYVQYRLGEELFNRGPLAGLRRWEARIPLLAATRARPGFGPAWEQLAWLETAEGDEEGARAARDSLRQLPRPEDAFSLASRMLIEIAAGYRFAEGRDAVGEALGTPEILGLPELAAAPRLMQSFDTPRGAIDFGGQFVESGSDPLVWSGSLAQVFGYFTLGQMAESRRLAGTRQRDGWPLFTAQLDAFLLLFDSAAAAVDRNRVLGMLGRYALPGTGTPIEQRRAAWTLALLHRQAGEDVDADRYAEPVGVDSGDQPLVMLLDAQRRAMIGDFDGALQLADSLGRWERASNVTAGAVGPFFRTALHLFQAEWHLANDNFEAARRRLLWHEGWDMDGLPIDEPRVEEVDWAFGTLARWRRAEVLELMGDLGSGELCDVYRDIDRLWTDGDSVYAARAESARQHFGERGCSAGGG